jgi:hydroxymethyl cephem carbamoyltransferase
MAFASFSKRSEPTTEETKLLRLLLDGPYRKLGDYEESNAPHMNVGVDASLVL